MVEPERWAITGLNSSLFYWKTTGIVSEHGVFDASDVVGTVAWTVSCWS